MDDNSWLGDGDRSEAVTHYRCKNIPVLEVYVSAYPCVCITRYFSLRNTNFFFEVMKSYQRTWK